MKSKLKNTVAVLAFSLLALLAAPTEAAPLGTAFTYQGRLTDGSSPATGNYDLQFILRDAASGGNQIGATLVNSPVVVNNGLFTVTLDFGSSAFDGRAYWLEIGVRASGSVGGFTTLNTLQAITPTPYALYALSAGAVTPDAVTGAGIQDATLTAAKFSNGQVVKSLNGLRENVTFTAGANITLSPSGNDIQIAASGGATSGWALGGNDTTGADFLGTRNAASLELRANSQRVLRLEPNGPGPFSSPNLIGGFSGNTAGSMVSGNTIGGGGAAGYTQRALGNFSTIGGGDWESHPGE